MSIKSFLIDRGFIKQPTLRMAITRLIYGSFDTTINLFGVALTINSAKENGYFRASRQAAHLSVFRDEARVLINLASLIDENTIFIDIGANIGLYAAVISRLRHLKSGLSVLAFEVNPDTFSRLEQNARRYGFEATCIGLTDRKEQKLFVEGAVSHVTTTFENKSKYNISSKTFRQKCVPLSDIEIPEGNIVLKIDVEGQEYEVLQGARKYFDNNRVKAVYLDGFSNPQVVSFLVGFGFNLYDGQTLERTDEHVFSLLAVKGRQTD